MTIMPHNHRMCSVIGVYTGREDNIFWRRLTDEAGGRVEAAGATSLGERDAEPLGSEIIHSVTNPLSRLSGAIHVCGGDFFAASAANAIQRRCSNGTTRDRSIWGLTLSRKYRSRGPNRLALIGLKDHASVISNSPDAFTGSKSRPSPTAF
jgi:hypothetical protein